MNKIILFVNIFYQATWVAKYVMLGVTKIDHLNYEFDYKINQCRRQIFPIHPQYKYMI